MSKYALNIAEDGRILSATFAKYAPADAVTVDENDSADAEIIEAIHDGKLHEYVYDPDRLDLDGNLIGYRFYHEPLPEVEPTVEQQIAELKSQLAATDYKVIKCSEAQLAGEELPYSPVELHAERQAMRDRINVLKGSVE